MITRSQQRGQLDNHHFAALNIAAHGINHKRTKPATILSSLLSAHLHSFTHNLIIYHGDSVGIPCEYAACQRLIFFHCTPRSSIQMAQVVGPRHRQCMAGWQRCGEPCSEMRNYVRGWIFNSPELTLCGSRRPLQGMREMRDAALIRKRKAQVQKPRTATGKSMFSFMGFGNKSRSKPRPRTLQQQRPPQSRKATHESHTSGRPSRPPPRPSGPPHKSSHRSGHRQDSHASASRDKQRRSSRR